MLHENSLESAVGFAYHEVDGVLDLVGQAEKVYSAADVREVLRRVLSFIRSKDKARATVDCIFLATGDAELENITMSSVAEKHAMTKAAIVPEQEGVHRIPTVFDNARVAELFDRAWATAPELIPMLGVQWYAGLRPNASYHLDWKDVDFDRRRILIHPHGNKLRQPDIVQDLPPTVFGLLSSFRKTEGPISHPNHIKLARKLHNDLGYRAGAKRWPEDVARHTFASNLYSLYDLESKRVEGALLHSTSAMLKKHYLLKNVPKESAETYFGSHLPSA